MGISHILFEMKCRKKKFSWKIRFLVSSVTLEVTVDVFHLENLCHSLLDIFVNYFITWGILCSVLQNNTTVRFSSLIYGMYALLWLQNHRILKFNFLNYKQTVKWRIDVSSLTIIYQTTTSLYVQSIDFPSDRIC